MISAPPACYGVLTAEGNELNVEFGRVPYDVEAATGAIEATEMPDACAQMLREGRG